MASRHCDDRWSICGFVLLGCRPITSPETHLEAIVEEWRMVHRKGNNIPWYGDRGITDTNLVNKVSSHEQRCGMQFRCGWCDVVKKCENGNDGIHFSDKNHSVGFVLHIKLSVLKFVEVGTLASKVGESMMQRAKNRNSTNILYPMSRYGNVHVFQSQLQLPCINNDSHAILLKCSLHTIPLLQYGRTGCVLAGWVFGVVDDIRSRITHRYGCFGIDDCCFRARHCAIIYIN